MQNLAMMTALAGHIIVLRGQHIQLTGVEVVDGLRLDDRDELGLSASDGEQAQNGEDQMGGEKMTFQSSILVGTRCFPSVKETSPWLQVDSRRLCIILLNEE
ncbi:hypothetical protein NL676_025019 [Syzygium grande]|nr:hypothetical protein NL676_025019 [Syzygium grande]